MGLRETGLQGSGEKYIMRSLMMCTAHQIFSGKKIMHKMGGACSTYGERRGSYIVLVVRPDGKISLGRSRSRRD